MCAHTLLLCRSKPKTCLFTITYVTEDSAYSYLVNEFPPQEKKSYTTFHKESHESFVKHTTFAQKRRGERFYLGKVGSYYNQPFLGSTVSVKPLYKFQLVNYSYMHTWIYMGIWFPIILFVCMPIWTISCSENDWRWLLNIQQFVSPRELLLEKYVLSAFFRPCLCL